MKDSGAANCVNDGGGSELLEASAMSTVVVEVETSGGPSE